MGCRQSKPKTPSSPKQSFTSFRKRSDVLSNISMTKTYDLQLTEKEMFLIKQSWKGIKRQMEDTGVEMFTRLFRNEVKIIKLFRKFSHIQSDDDVRRDEAVEHHASLVMNTLDDAIVNIDNAEYVHNLMYKTGAFHMKFAGFKPELFLTMREPFLEAVKITLGDRYTDKMQLIYRNAISFILHTMIDGAYSAAEDPS